MGRGSCIVADDNVPEHREVLDHAGRRYARNDVADSAAVLRELVDDPAGRTEFGAFAAARPAARPLLGPRHK